MEKTVLRKRQEQDEQILKTKGREGRVFGEGEKSWRARGSGQQEI